MEHFFYNADLFKPHVYATAVHVLSGPKCSLKCGVINE
jgi:hypothetical protein